MKKKGKKGKYIYYPDIQMSEYLLPNYEISIDGLQNISEIRNKMSDIPSSYSSDNANTSKCACGEKEDMEHIYLFELSPGTSLASVGNRIFIPGSCQFW